MAEQTSVRPGDVQPAIRKPLIHIGREGSDHWLCGAPVRVFLGEGHPTGRDVCAVCKRLDLQELGRRR